MRRAIVLAGGVAVILTATLSVPRQAATALAARPSGAVCVDDYLIGSRGSGQELPGRDQYDGLGPEVFQFSQRFAADMERAGRSYQHLANPYPAVAVSPGGNSDGWMFNLAGVITGLPIGKYDSSVATGVAVSLKRPADLGLAPGAAELVRFWRRTLRSGRRLGRGGTGNSGPDGQGDG
jgi:hypothetical protein